MTALFCQTFAAAGYTTLRLGWQADYSLRWLALTAGMLLYLLWVLRRELTSNHRAGESLLLADLGAGNAITLLRGTLTAGLAGFWLQQEV